MSKPFDEAWRALDGELLEAEQELEREKGWLRDSITEDELVMGWCHDLVTTKDVADYEPDS